MWQGFEKVRQPPYHKAVQLPPHLPPPNCTHPHRKPVSYPGFEYRQAHRPRGMPGYAHLAGDVQPASRGP